jgi:flagellar hook-length control protein FliK
MPVYAAPGLEPRLGAPGWDNALGQKVLWMVSQQQQVAELSLNPPDLGPLRVVLSMNGDQASAMFVSQQPDVRQALEAALPRLKEMMADSGINLSNTTVSSDSPQQQREFERQGRPGARYGNGGGGVGGQGIDIGAAHIRSGGNGLVDTFA